MKNEKLFEVQQIDGTPFAMLIKEDEIQLVIGNNIVSPKFTSEKETLEWLEKKPWELITATIGVICENIIKYNTKNE